MKCYQVATFSLAAIAALTIAPVITQAQFKVPTHPTLAEVAMQRSAPGMQMAEAPLATLPDAIGQRYFRHPPSLIRTNAIYTSARNPSTYEFTIALPADAGAALKAVTIVQAQNLETVRFNVPQSHAFAGAKYAAGPSLVLASIGGTQDPPGTATIVFDQPVQPGQTITVAVEVKANPSSGGVYEFGVTAYPTDQAGRGQFLGYGRINLHGNR
jgi:hypothetical protein